MGLRIPCARFPVAGLGLRCSVFGPRRRFGTGCQVPGPGYPGPGAPVSFHISNLNKEVNFTAWSRSKFSPCRKVMTG